MLFCTTVPAKITSLGEVIYTPLRSNVNLQCRYVGEPMPASVKWFANNHEPSWLQQRSMFGLSSANIDSITSDKAGNYTCYVENPLGTDSISYQIHVQSNSTPQPIIKGNTCENFLP